jgi:hypothetical protein
MQSYAATQAKMYKNTSRQFKIIFKNNLLQIFFTLSKKKSEQEYRGRGKFQCSHFTIVG